MGSIDQREREAAQVHDGLAGDFEGAQGERAGAGGELHLAESEGVEIFHLALAVARDGVLIGVKRRVPAGLDFGGKR